MTGWPYAIPRDVHERALAAAARRAPAAPEGGLIRALVSREVRALETTIEQQAERVAELNQELTEAEAFLRRKRGELDALRAHLAETCPHQFDQNDRCIHCDTKHRHGQKDGTA